MTDFTQLSDKELSEALGFHRRQRNMSRGLNESANMRQTQMVRLLEAEEARRLNEEKPNHYIVSKRKNGEYGVSQDVGNNVWDHSYHHGTHKTVDAAKAWAAKHAGKYPHKIEVHEEADSIEEAKKNNALVLAKNIAKVTSVIKKEEVEINEAKLERNKNTVGAHHLERDSGDHKMYTAYTGSLVRRLHTVTDKDDNVLGQGTTAASAMLKAKLKKPHRDALMHDDNQIVNVHDTRGATNVGTRVTTPGKAKWFKNHDEAMQHAKSLPGKIRHADAKTGHVD